MIIYKAHVTLCGKLNQDLLSKLTKKHTASRARNCTEKFYLTEASPYGLVICRISEENAVTADELRNYLSRLSIPYSSVTQEQICIGEFVRSLHNGFGEDLCPEPKEILTEYSMTPYMFKPFSQNFHEGFFVPCAFKKFEKELVKQHSVSLLDELKRVLACADIPFKGHPVLYSIISDSWEKSAAVLDPLLPVLNMVGHLPAYRICFLQIGETPLPDSALTKLYSAQSGATMVVDCTGQERTEEVEAFLHTVSRLAREHRDDVLTVFRACRDDVIGMQYLREVTEGLPIVTLQKDNMPRSIAKSWLAERAKEAGLGKISFAKTLPAGKDAFSEPELETFFQGWQDEYLCKEIYPAYSEVICAKKEIVKDMPASSAMTELQNLVGLSEAKRIISQVLDYTRIQKLCQERGLPTEAPHLHMVFTGNPGTAKTTVARLVARIFRECGVLSKGDLIEVGRSDLIGKYVGWTAKMVKDVFNRAEGSVLFIDEAYSLLDDTENQFGDEAINTIVQEMENRRDKTVVIFAGYREPMEQLLNRNAGLRSRVSYQIDFPDYSEEELMDIVRLTVREKSRNISDDSENTVRQMLRTGMEQPNFGNGRYARKIVEQAMMRQASRLASVPNECISNSDLLCLTAEDFATEEVAPRVIPVRQIGFCA